MKLAWLTDVHLNFLPTADVEKFLHKVLQEAPDGVLLGGDIAEAHNVVDYLARFDAVLTCPVWFVLGNHDFYHGSIGRVRDEVARFCADRPLLNYLSVEESFTLSAERSIGLVGHDGWADVRIGDYERSLVMMNDYQLIEDLAGLDKRARLEVLHRLGDESAEHLLRVAEQALQDHEEVYVLTHVPPLREACWYEGEISDDQWAPHFTCKAVGQALLDLAGRYRQRRITVFCGHTHGRGECHPRPNLTIFTGAAEYGLPAIERCWRV